MDLRPGTSLVIGVEHLESPSFGFLASHSTLMLHDPRAFIERLDVILVAAVLGGSKRDIVPSMSRFETLTTPCFSTYVTVSRFEGGDMCAFGLETSSESSSR